jgi:hypothetical protein
MPRPRVRHGLCLFFPRTPGFPCFPVTDLGPLPVQTHHAVRPTIQMEVVMQRTMEKKMYVRPVVEDFGTVTDLTATGQTNPGSDFKGGSAASQGG